MKIAVQALGAALVAATCLTPAAHAANFYAFGDSLSDNGNIPKLTGGADFPPAPYVGNRFSNGPTWAEYFPQLAGLGFAPSNDYAVGGAFAGPLSVLGTTYTNLENLPTALDSGSPGFTTPLPSFLGEVQEFAATGQHLQPSDVVSVWVGANEYFAALDEAAADPASATATISSVVKSVATQTVQGIDELAALGGKRFLLFTLPDLGDTPYLLGTGSAADIALGDEISAAHGSALAQGAELAHYTTGANIIVVNEQTIFNELLADPAKYGKTNTTEACIDTSCVTQSVAQQNQYLFWDTVHPTTGTHQIIAEYAAAALQGVSGLVVPAQVGAFGADAFIQQMDSRLAGLQAGASGFALNLPGQAQSADIGADDASAPQIGKLGGFFSGSYDYGNRKTETADSGFNYNVETFAVGLDDLVAQGVALGAALGYGNDNATINGDGKVSGNAYQLGAYATFFQPKFYMNLKFGYGFDGYNNSRPGAVGDKLTAKPSGSTYEFATSVGYVLHAGQVTYGPVAGIDLADAHIAAYTEQGDPALTQSVESQDFERVVGDLGAEASLPLQLGGVVLQPKLTATVDDLFSGNGGNFDSVFTDEPLVPITSVYPKATKIWGVLSGGISANLTSRLTLAASFSTTVAKDDGEDQNVTGSLKYRF